MAVGVARPSAHGHAMISTAIAALTAKLNRAVSGPGTSQTTKVTAAIPMTAGTK